MYLHTKSGKRLVSLLAAISAFVVIESAAPFTAYAANYGTGVVNTQYLNMRSENSTGSPVLRVLLKGTSLTLLEEKDGWYKVTFNGTTGWISADYVQATVNASTTETPSATTAATTAAATTKATTATKATTTTTTAPDLGNIVVTADYLYLRSGPGKNYAVIGGLANGRSTKALEKNGSWVKVTVSGKTGWVSADYVKFTTSATTTAAKTTKATTATTKKTTTTTKKTTTTTKKTTTTTKSNTSTGGKSTSATGKITITADVLNARSDASTSSSIVGTVRHNEVYTYSAVKNGWYKITIPSGKSAYVSGDYVKTFSSYAVKGGGSYLWPVQSYSRISSYFGPRDGRNHNGIDIAAPGGSQIMAVAPGRVIKKAYEAGGFGNYIVIQQSDGICAYYGHMQAPSFLSVGTSVKAGDTIGLVGSTGRSTGNHLHLEFRRGTTKINPLNYYPNMR